MELKQYPHNAKYLIKSIDSMNEEKSKDNLYVVPGVDEIIYNNLQQGKNIVRNLESRKDTKWGTVKWLPVQYLDSEQMDWIRTQWIEKEIKDQDE